MAKAQKSEERLWWEAVADGARLEGELAELVGEYEELRLAHDGKPAGGAERKRFAMLADEIIARRRELRETAIVLGARPAEGVGVAVANGEG